MLFSHPEVAAFMSDRFVCAWESLRPVPKVEIDFGDGVHLRRTLNGNIVTYLCTPDGRVFDLLPGLHSPEGYLAGLRRGLDLYEAARSAVEARPGTSNADAGDPGLARRNAVESTIARVHAMQAGGGDDVAIFPGGRVGPSALSYASKMRVEDPIRVLLGGRWVDSSEAQRSAMSQTLPRIPLATPSFEPAAKSALEVPVRRALAAPPNEDPFAPGLDAAALLAMDTRINERLRREKGHAFLASAPLPAPRQIQEALYREFFGLDLADPYLGLAPTLFGGAEAIPE